MDISWIIAFPITLLAILLVAISVSLIRRLQQRKAFQELAERLGMDWQSQGGFDPGRVRGRRGADELTIDFGTDASSPFARSVTAVELTLVPAIDADFQIGKENALTRLRHRAGIADVEIGDADLDDLLLIRAKDEERLRKVLTERARRSLRTLAHDVDDLRLEHDHLLVVWTGRVMDVAVLENTATALFDAASELRRHP